MRNKGRKRYIKNSRYQDFIKQFEKVHEITRSIEYTASPPERLYFETIIITYQRSLHRWASIIFENNKHFIILTCVIDYRESLKETVDFQTRDKYYFIQRTYTYFIVSLRNNSCFSFSPSHCFSRFFLSLLVLSNCTYSLFSWSYHAEFTYRAWSCILFLHIPTYSFRI